MRCTHDLGTKFGGKFQELLDSRNIVTQMNVLQSNLLFGDPKSGFELGVACRPSSCGGSFLLIDFCDPTAECVGAM